MHEKKISKMNLRGANDRFLYFSVDNQCEEPLVILNWRLEKIALALKFQSKHENEPYFISEFLDQIDNRQEKYILLYDNKIVILDEQTGLVLNTVLIETIYFIIDSNNFINVFDEANKRVYSYDLNGICVKETKLENFDDNFGFNMDKNDRLNFFDWNSNSIYYS